MLNDPDSKANTGLSPAISDVFARTVHAPLPAVRAAAARVDLIGPLVDGLVALGVEDHVVAPCSDGLVWRFDGSGYRRVRLAWSLQVEPETDDATLVTLAVRLAGSDDVAGDRLRNAWPVLGPIVELHAKRILRAVETLAEEDDEERLEPLTPKLRVVSPR